MPVGIIPRPGFERFRIPIHPTNRRISIVALSPREHLVPTKAAGRDTISLVPFVYVLRCGDGSLYTGAAVDVGKRLREHQAGKASRYTRSRLPVDLVWSAEVETWSDALREERRIKRLRRAKKEEMLAGAGRSG